MKPSLIHGIWPLKRHFVQMKRLLLLALFVIGTSFIAPKPTLYIIGDSTVRNGDGSGKNGQWGWGSLIAQYFDTAKISISNQAIGGRSSRTFITEGRWEKILNELHAGDYVIMQFGHNDAGPLDDTARARGTIRGTGEESKEIYNPVRKQQEVVHTYGWYIRKYIAEAKAKGAIPIVCSPVPRERWQDGKISRANDDYGKWARETAKSGDVMFIDLNNLVAEKYEAMGADRVKTLFHGDHTHTSRAGAELNAKVVTGELKPVLGKYLLPPQRLIKKKQTLVAMRLANQYFMQKWPDPGKPTFVKKERPSNLWTRAVYYEGLMALYSIDKKKSYYNYAVQWAESHQWGLWGGPQVRNADNQCCGQTYLDLYRIDKKEERIRDIKASMDNMIDSDKIDDWWWIDALQMAMPVFVKLGVLYKDTSYFSRMYDMYAYTKYKHGDNGLYNPDDHLWWRDKDFDPPYKEPNGEDCYWSRGNGWVVAALVRTLEGLPASDPHYAEYLQDYKDMLQALLPLQRPDGFWNASLHDPGNYGGKELTGTSLFVYGMAWGINKGIIDRETYLPVVIKAWNALVKDCVHPDGQLGWVQSTGKEPKDGQPVSYDKIPDFEDYGLGCFLLGGSEVYKLKN